jgi:hypothetical protein
VPQGRNSSRLERDAIKPLFLRERRWAEGNEVGQRLEAGD